MVLDCLIQFVLQDLEIGLYLVVVFNFTGLFFLIWSYFICCSVIVFCAARYLFLQDKYDSNVGENIHTQDYIPKTRELT